MRLTETMSRVMRVVSEDLRLLTPGKVLAETSRLLPQQTFGRLRTMMLRGAGVEVGAQSLILGPVRLTGTGHPRARLSIGISTLITGPLHVDLGAPVRIGDRVQIGHDVALLTVNHEIGPEHMRAGANNFGAIEIGDGVWIASRVTVLPGVVVGAGSVIAAGAVVTRNVPPNTLVAGIPARVVRNLIDALPRDPAGE